MSSGDVPGFGRAASVRNPVTGSEGQGRAGRSDARDGSRISSAAFGRNLGMGLIRQAGLSEIAATVRAAQDDNDLLLATPPT